MTLPYLNDVKLIANLAVAPEMSLNAKGRRYCNFSLRLMYRDSKGDPMTDFVNVTAYDDDAEAVVRDCKAGDLLFVNGYLTMMRWEQQGKTYSKLVVIAYSVQLLGTNDGMPDIDSATPSLYPYKGFLEKNEHQYIRSVCIDSRPDDIPSDRYLYPQPLPDGTWTFPNATEKPNGPTMTFLKKHPEVMKRMRDGSSRQTGDEDDRVASTLLPENLPVRTVKGKRVVFKPDGRYMTEKMYVNTVNMQRDMLLAMPPERRLRVISIAENRYGYIKKFDTGLPSVATEEQISAMMEATESWRQDDFKPEQVAFEDTSVNQSQGLGDGEDDWYQDAKGEWHLKGNDDVGGGREEMDGKKEGK